MIVLIGSRAAHWHYPNFWNKCNDTDLIASFDDFSSWYSLNKNLVKTCFPFDNGKKFFVELNSGDIFEWEIAHPNSTGRSLLAKVEGSILESSMLDVPGNNIDMLVPSMDWLFTLKSSHKYLKDSPHFDKTIHDYHLMKYDLGCKIADKQWHKEREKVTYTYSHPNLNQNKKGFFSTDGTSLMYVYDHDTIHKAVAKYGFNDRPAYTYYMKDGAEVFSDRKKWKSLSEEMRMRGAIEETYVLALERSQIPYRGEINPIDSFKIALSKVSTSITSGWFRRYVYENYYKVLDMYNDSYIDWLDMGIENGIVLPFK